MNDVRARSGPPVEGGLRRALLLLAAVSGSATAAAPAERASDCTNCPATSGWELVARGGPALIHDATFSFGDYTGLDEQGGYLFGDLLARRLDGEAGYLELEGHARGPDALALFVEAGRYSRYAVTAWVQAVPRRVFDSAATPYLGSGTDRLTLPANWVRAPVTGSMTTLGSAAQPATIGWDRDNWGLGIDLTPARRWQLRADYTRQERKGRQRSSGSFLFDAVEFAAPVDYVTEMFEAAADYSADTWQASLAYYGSVFSNAHETLTWDNPYVSLPGADTGQLALAPDNEAHRVTLSGALRLPARTTLNGQIAVGHVTQNEDLPGYTTNPLLVTDPLPATAADAEADTLNLNLRAVVAPWSRVTLEGELRYDDLDNETRALVYDGVVTDMAPAVALAGTAYDYERRDLRLRGEYRLPAGMRFNAGFDTSRFARNAQDRRRTTTDRLWVGMRARLGSRADLDAELFAEERDGSGYRAGGGPVAPENPLLRKYNMADREREGIRLRGTAAGGERADFGWEIEYGEDRYDGAALGLADSDYLRFGGDLSVLIGERASANLSAYHEEIETRQLNSQSFAAADWAATTGDRFTTATFGLAWPNLLGRIDAELEYAWSLSVGETDNDTSGLQTAFPDLRSKRRSVRLGLSYPYSESLRFGLECYFESVDTGDWSLDGVEPAAVPNLLSLGVDAWNHNVGAYYFSVAYRL